MYKSIDLSNSIIGFHNPRKHKGLSSEEFLMLYLRRQARRSWNKVSTERAILCVQVLKDWDNWLLRVKSMFPNTLQ